VTDTEFDPTTCVTAGSLRLAGLKVPEAIPDCAWVPRHAISLQLSEVETANTGEFRFKIFATLREPLRWLQVNWHIDFG